MSDGKIRVTRYLNILPSDLPFFCTTIEGAAKKAAKLQYSTPVCVAVPVIFDLSIADYKALMEIENTRGSKGKD